MVKTISTGALILPLVSLLLLDYVHPAAITPLEPTGKDQSDVMSYMMDYGYLEPKDPRLGEVRTKAELDRAIMQLQEFAGLKVTGKIDADTVKLIKTPRCAMPDFGPSDNMRRRKRYALHDSEWRKLHLTYRILNSSYEELTKEQIRATVRKAFDMWSKVSPLRFREKFVGDADLRISFERQRHNDGYPFDGRGNKIAHAFFPHDNIDEDGDIHFDDQEHWTLDKPKVGTDFMWTAVHEIGHAIGVDHSTYYDAIMYPYYTGYKPDLKLHEDDVMAIQAKYGKPPATTETPTMDPSFRMSGPSPCNTSFDAVFHSKDGNTYFFRGEYFWTLDKHNRMLGARKIKDVWKNLRANIQAAYTKRNGQTVFFKGKRYWVYEGTKHIDGPNRINQYGLPEELKRLDAAFTWSGNGKTYFFKGDKYWRYNEQTKRLDLGYPKNISEGWGAVRYPVDSVMTWKDGQSYFFKGQNFSKYIFRKWRIYKPEKTSEFFFNCDQPVFVSGDENPEVVAKEDKNGNGADSRTAMFAPLIVLFTIFVSLMNCS